MSHAANAVVNFKLSNYMREQEPLRLYHVLFRFSGKNTKLAENKISHLLFGGASYFHYILNVSLKIIPF